MRVRAPDDHRNHKVHGSSRGKDVALPEVEQVHVGFVTALPRSTLRDDPRPTKGPIPNPAGADRDSPNRSFFWLRTRAARHTAARRHRPDGTRLDRWKWRQGRSNLGAVQRRPQLLGDLPGSANRLPGQAEASSSPWEGESTSAGDEQTRRPARATGGVKTLSSSVRVVFGDARRDRPDHDERLEEAEAEVAVFTEAVENCDERDQE